MTIAPDIIFARTAIDELARLASGYQSAIQKLPSNAERKAIYYSLESWTDPKVLRDAIDELSDMAKKVAIKHGLKANSCKCFPMPIPTGATNYSELVEQLGEEFEIIDYLDNEAGFLLPDGKFLNVDNFHDEVNQSAAFVEFPNEIEFMSGGTYVDPNSVGNPEDYLLGLGAIRVTQSAGDGSLGRFGMVSDGREAAFTMRMVYGAPKPTPAQIKSIKRAVRLLRKQARTHPMIYADLMTYCNGQWAGKPTLDFKGFQMDHDFDKNIEYLLSQPLWFGGDQATIELNSMMPPNIKCACIPKWAESRYL